MTAAMPDNRRDELLAGMALGDLSREETAELDQAVLIAGEDESFDRLAAELDIALLTDNLEEPPAELLQTLHREADRYIAGPAATPAADAEEPVERSVAGRIDSAGASGAVGTLGWIAAAACLLLAALAWIPLGPAAIDAPPTYAALAERPDAMVVGLSADLAGEQPIGSLVWSEEAQSGVMRFEGLAPLDPSEASYQLWIFDASRETFQESPLEIRHPVDGGVFNVASGGVAEVPIRNKLPVGEPVLFAVTIEPPGGVVVSDRSRIAAVGIPG